MNEHEFGHVCNVCGESFPEALDLLAHAEVHARSAEYRCMICGEIMSDESSLAVHVQVKQFFQPDILFNQLKKMRSQKTNNRNQKAPYIWDVQFSLFSEDGANC